MWRMRWAEHCASRCGIAECGGHGSEAEAKRSAEHTHTTELLGTLRVDLAQASAGRERDGAVAGCGAPSNVAGARHAGHLLLALLADRELGTAECGESGCC